MPRTARIISQSGYYHVMMRGIDRQLIFKDEEDYSKFRSLFNHCRSKFKISLLAWCMMPNHVHLLIKDTSNSLSTFFRYFGSGFAQWYNKKYDRVGHLFQDRFRSEPIEDSSYLLKAIRYIHLNPVKVKICSDPAEYQYSSCAYYLQSGHYSSNDMLFGVMPFNDFVKFHYETNDDLFLDVDREDNHTITDEKARSLLKQLFSCDDFIQIRTLSNKQQESLFKLLRSKGASFLQLSRLSGFPISEIQRLL